MDAVVLALVSAALFGGMTVAVRFGFAGGDDARLASLATTATAFAVCTAVTTVSQGWSRSDLGGVAPYALAGLIAPGVSQVLFTRAVAEAGPSRASVVVGTAPLVSFGLAVVFLDEPLSGVLVAGALLIVLGGLALASERVRPEHFRAAGIGFAFACTVAFSIRDNLVRGLADRTDVPSLAAASAALGAGVLLMLSYQLAVDPPTWRRFRGAVRSFGVAGTLFGLSYAALFEAYFRGRVTVVSPLVATESLWGVTLSALLLRRTEVVGRRLLLGAALVVAGGALIGATR